MMNYDRDINYSDYACNATYEQCLRWIFFKFVEKYSPKAALGWGALTQTELHVKDAYI